ncbi:caffeoylshikimate esterase-like isoform X1 [Iris pallida]|uniref:Caffeoylshikimate esterase-like isoform X1 n=1 Tax=Iris pallida TaxID=29817 RepID=A0AAX6IMS7_IRIPA|nr:caffeoylshikimate esterase-like isoform X1 [Iris pallida]KAJ6853585.1 caffeoylshikimate esterase-like isoform X1 [Iris pallida]
MAKTLPKGKLVPRKDLAEMAFKEPNKRDQCCYNVIAYNKDKPRLQTAVELLRTTQERAATEGGLSSFINSSWQG